MKVTDPIVVDRRVTAHSANIELVVPHELEYFKGHFPLAPIVPGVVQIKWALDLARRFMHVEGEFAGCEVLKFQHVMTPGARATLEIERVEASGKLAFSFQWQKTRYSSGRLLLRPAA